MTDALAALYAGWQKATAERPDMSLDEVRGLFEHWGDVTGEPGGVDYVEDVAAGLPAMWALPKQRADDRVLLCMHGGGYVLGSMYSHRKLYGHFAKAVGCRALIVDYRRAPENLHPGPVDDMVTAYRWLIEDRGIDPAHIVFIGDSAGGALAITTMLRARERGLPLPVASVPIAPYLDTEAKGESYVTNNDLDALGNREATIQFMGVFLGPDGDRHDPLANPLFADLEGLSPMLIQIGGYDVLLDDARAFADKARAAGVPVDLEIEPAQQHVFHFLAGNSPVADAAIARAAAWIRTKLGLV